MSRLDYMFVSQDLALKVDTIDIKTKYMLDHSRLEMKIDFSKHKAGKSYWKFNNKHLQDRKFLQEMNELILGFLYEVKNENLKNPDSQWIELKDKITAYAKLFSQQKAKEKSQFIEKMEMRILNLDQKLVQATTIEERNKIEKDIKNTENFLLNEHEEKVKAACFRSKAQYFLYGEKNSKYFFNLEKSRGSSKIISNLRGRDGVIIDNPKEILKEERLFYKKLYGEPKTLEKWPYKNETDKKLSEAEKQDFEKEITDLECSNSLMGMANNKSPGLDGLTAEFYKTFWIHLKSIWYSSTFCFGAGLAFRISQTGNYLIVTQKRQRFVVFGKLASTHTIEC